jgi:hypothetical protein
MSLTLDGTTGISATGNIYGNNIIVTNTLTAGVFSPTNLSASGNITASFFIGNGSQLTGIDATQIQSGTSNVKVVSSGGNATIGIGGTGNIAVFATTGAFFTGVASASGNVIGGNILTAGLISATSTITSAANVVGGNITTGGQISATGNITGGNIRTAGLISATGAITGAVLTGTSLTVSTGNITGGNLLLSGAIVDSAQLDIQTSASNANIAMAPNGTGIVTVSTQVSAVGNVTGGNLRTAGLISATGAITGAALTGSSLTVSTGNVTAGNIVNSNANGVGNIGSSTTYFNTVFAKATSAQYADLAEMYSAGAHYEPGTVVIFGGSYEVEISTSSHANTVAGVISTNPSYIMNAGQTGPHVAAVALQGRVPTRVIGTVCKGDRMVTSDLPGVATVLDPLKYEPGCILGKALIAHEPTFDENGNEIVGTIEVVVGRI